MGNYYKVNRSEDYIGKPYDGRGLAFFQPYANNVYKAERHQFRTYNTGGYAARCKLLWRDEAFLEQVYAYHPRCLTDNEYKKNLFDYGMVNR